MRKVNAEGTERKKRKKWPIIVVVIIGLFLLAAAGGGSSDDNTSGSSGTQTQNDIKHSQSEQAAAETMQDSEEEDTENPKSKGYTVGETWKNKYISVSYLEAGEYTDYSEYFSPADGYKIIYAKFEFENIGSLDQVVSFTDWNCYADGYACENYYITDDPSSSYGETLSAGRKCNGIIAFSVPEDAKSIEFEYDANFWTSENILFLYQ